MLRVDSGAQETVSGTGLLPGPRGPHVISTWDLGLEPHPRPPNPLTTEAQMTQANAHVRTAQRCGLFFMGSASSCCWSRAWGGLGPLHQARVLLGYRAPWRPGLVPGASGWLALPPSLSLSLSGSWQADSRPQSGPRSPPPPTPHPREVDRESHYKTRFVSPCFLKAEFSPNEGDNRPALGPGPGQALVRGEVVRAGHLLLTRLVSRWARVRSELAPKEEPSCVGGRAGSWWWDPWGCWAEQFHNVGPDSGSAAHRPGPLGTWCDPPARGSEAERGGREERMKQPRHRPDGQGAGCAVSGEAVGSTSLGAALCLLTGSGQTDGFADTGRMAAAVGTRPHRSGLASQPRPRPDHSHDPKAHHLLSRGSVLGWCRTWGPFSIPLSTPLCPFHTLFMGLV